MRMTAVDRRDFVRLGLAMAAAALLPLRGAHAGHGAHNAHTGQLVHSAHAGQLALSAHAAQTTRVTHAPAALAIGVVLPHDHPALSGARLGGSEAEHAARLFGTDFTLHEATAAGGPAVREAAERLVTSHGALVLIGGAAAADADAIADVARTHEVLFLNVGVAADAVARRCDRFAFHVQPSSAARQAALESVADAPPGARAALWHPSLTRFGAAQVNDRFVDAFERPMSEDAWAGWLAVKIAFDAALRAPTVDAAALAAHLTAARTVFDGHKGLQLSFRPGTHELRQPLYIVAGDDVIADVPSVRDAAGRSHAELLDALDADSGSCS